MFFNAIALVTFLGACHCAEHAYSSQSITRFDEHKQEHKYDVKIAIPVITKVVPLAKIVPVKAIPVATYVHEQGYSKGHGGQEYSNHHAVSSQHIVREDKPAHPPADFYKEHGPAKYEFEYKVEDPHTGDKKFQHETRNGHSLKGVYSLHEGDGSIRTVEYGADKHSGFVANVKHTTKHIEDPKRHY